MLEMFGSGDPREDYLGQTQSHRIYDGVAKIKVHNFLKKGGGGKGSDLSKERGRKEGCKGISDTRDFPAYFDSFHIKGISEILALAKVHHCDRIDSEFFLRPQTW